jgi:hypothetical protein
MPSNSDKADIHLKVSQERKDRWVEHFEERPDVSTLSELIRLSVESEIAGEYRDEDEKQREVIDLLSNIQNHIIETKKEAQNTNKKVITQDELEDQLGVVVNKMDELKDNE